MLINKLQDDLKQAQLNRDQVKVSTLRLLLSELKNAEIAKQTTLSDEDVVSIIQREVKRRKEAILGFKSGGREDQASREQAEEAILQSYLPAQMPIEELTKIIERAINELGAKDISGMGKVMGKVMEEVKGQSDGGTVSALVKDRLSG